MGFTCLGKGGTAPAREKGRGPSVRVSHSWQANWVDHAPARGNTSQLTVSESKLLDHAPARGNTNQLTVRQANWVDHATARGNTNQLTVKASKLLDYVATPVS